MIFQIKVLYIQGVAVLAISPLLYTRKELNQCIFMYSASNVGLVETAGFM